MSFAQIRDDLAQPAETPPSSYSGRQYVDSRGCIYIRAGIDGNVTWVPRVDRDRKVICGQSASGGGGGSRVAETPKPRPQPEPVRTEAPEPAPAPVVAAPAPRPEPRPAPKPAPRRVVREATPPAAAPRPRTVRKATPTPKRQVVRRAAAPTPRVVVEEKPVRTAPRRVVVGGYTDLPPNTVLRSEDGLRKGPVLVVDRSGKVVKTTGDGVRVYAGDSRRKAVTGKTRIAPKRAYEKGASVKVPVPDGYEPAFKDGRHSRTRAHQTLDGRRKMLLKWSNTVPRKLIDQYTGEEVGVYFPELKYPYRSMKEQRAAMMSSRSEAPKAAPKKLRRVQPSLPASHRYIQLGSFSSRARAEGAIRRLQGAGYPVAVNEYTKSGTHYWMVLAGPFRHQARLTSALEHVRYRIGYRSASLRP